MVIPESLWDAVNKIQDTILICAPAVSQHVALAALRVGASLRDAHLGRARRDAPPHGRRPRPARRWTTCRSRRRVLLLPARAIVDRRDALDRAADPRAQRRGHSGIGLRRTRRLLRPRVVRRAGRCDGDGGHAAGSSTDCTRSPDAMKLITWNVNGIRARQAQLQQLLAAEQPDVVCLQEIKASPDQVPALLVVARRLLVLLARRRRVFRRGAAGAAASMRCRLAAVPASVF